MPDTQEDRLADFTTDRRVLALSLLAGVAGAASAVVALALVKLIALITNLSYFHTLSTRPSSPDHAAIGIWSVFIPVIGGLIIGLMARYGSSKIRGHGIPEALEAILIGRSKIGPKVAVLKPLSSAISIGTGGPFGAEGPIIMTGGALGSLLAQFFHLSSAERKTLLVAGAAGGMAAIFGTPVAAVLLAVELLLFEWKPRSFIPVAIASAVAAALRVPLMGGGALFPVVPHAALGIEGLLIAFGVGIAAGLASGALTNLVYGFEDAFHRLPIHWAWWPAIGGFFVGIGGVLDPRVLGVGYETIHQLLRGEILGTALLGLILGKSLVWSIALGSGTSGGVLAPLLMMGGTLGALEAHWLPIGSPGLWAIISMAAMMGGTMRSPFASLVFTMELTHDLNLLPALLLGCIGSETVTVLLLRRSILTEKVARRGHHITREYSVDPFDIHRVGEIMTRDVFTLPASMLASEMVAEMSKPGGRLARKQGACLINDHGKLVGIVTQSDILRVLEERQESDPLLLEVGCDDLVTIHEDDLLRDAVVKMLENDIGRLPVVDRDDKTKLVGYVSRKHLMAARQRWYEEEHVRERIRKWPRRVSQQST